MELYLKDGLVYSKKVLPSGTVLDTFHDMEFHIKLSTDKETILSDGADTAIVTAKVYNYEGEYQVEKDMDVSFEVEGVTKVIPLISGQCSVELTSEEVGEIKIICFGEGIRNGEVVIKVG